jgi:hypothetical protein
LITRAVSDAILESGVKASNEEAAIAVKEAALALDSELEEGLDLPIEGLVDDQAKKRKVVHKKIVRSTDD